MIIVGGGCAGYGCGIYSGRYNMKTLIIAKERGGLITKTGNIENYPGFVSISGFELAQNLENHAKQSGAEILDDIVISVKKEGDIFVVGTESSKTFSAKTILIATGTKHRKLEVDGEKELEGKGLSYCATCDGAFFKNKIVGMVGGGDSAVKEAILLTQYASKVYLLVKFGISAEPINMKKLKENPKIEIVENVGVAKIGGKDAVAYVELDNEYKGSKRIDLGGLFVAIGQIPQNEIAKQLNLKFSKQGEIIIDKDSNTSLEGAYAAGDITEGWKQAITGVAQGSMAAHTAFEYIKKKF